ncbi:hypothetical protein EJ02DRAFT_432880 [Clathrospora elynae]|uniref:Xaa-Pro aminopeptidase n=1 Tax=Clathrospora elynae TaxID=706981 RepID=A0A6A5SW05_9PLEO|nr:hypothetical protein EJ02DRAFT_432880 [Clathrospora elynae]
MRRTMELLDATSLPERLQWEDKQYCMHLEAGSPFEKYPAKQHAQRVQEKLGVEEGLVYLPGQPAWNNEDSDMPAPFRQRRYFYYLSGCNEPSCHLTYDIQRDTLTLFIPRINPARVIWNGRGSTPAEALVKYDVDEVHYHDELPAFVHKWMTDVRNQHAGYYVLHESSQIPGYPAVGPRVDSKSLQPAMNIARMIKDDHEIKLIRKANDISSQAHREVLANILTFKNEAQVEGLFMNVCISHQAKQQAYDPIAASGPNAGTLHYDANNEDLADRQLMCLDAGCEYELYASDITRTFPLSASWPSKEAESIYKLVQHMQETCIGRLAPGVRYLDLHILAHQIAINGLLQLGIFHNGTREEIYKSGTSKAFFPHGLGHHIGLEVHDVGQTELMSVRRGKPVYQQAPSFYPENFHNPVYDAKTCHAPTDPQSSHLEEGMVVTVEPGIYFSVYALEHFYLSSPVHSKYINIEVVERYLPVGGVRIEDDILITSKGYENLTTAPKGEKMLDIIRGGKEISTDAPDRRPKPSLRRNDGNETPLLRAPGISSKAPHSILKPLARATTMPAEFRHHDDADFEPFAGPSLFEKFPRSMTTGEKIQQWRQKSDHAPAPQQLYATVEQSMPVCGEVVPNVQHLYLSGFSSLASKTQQNPQFKSVSKCKNCVVLVQTLDRLRQNLSPLAQNSPKPEPMSTMRSDARNKKAGQECLGFPEENLHEPQQPRILHDRSRALPGNDSASRFSARDTPPSNSLSASSSARVLDDRNATIPLRSKNAVHTTPPVPESDIEAVRQEMERLQMRLRSLEDNAHLKAYRREHNIRSDPLLNAQPSMPNLRPHGLSQQLSVRPRAEEMREFARKRSSLLDDLLIDDQRLERRERDRRQELQDRVALKRDPYFTR